MALIPDPTARGEMSIADCIITALENSKALDIRRLDVRELTDITDDMIIANGTSRRHVSALAEQVRVAGRQLQRRALSIEGESEGEWVVLDYGEAVIHLMVPDARTFYDLEGLWDTRLGEILRQQRELKSDG